MLVIGLLSGEGRLPNVEVRKIHPDGSKETFEKELFGDTSNGEMNEATVEDGLDKTEERTTTDELNSRLLPKMGEDFWDDGWPLSLYVYGVRHQHLILLIILNSA